jgi:NADH:ubiquinone oxidoreductase subunit E
MEVLMSGQSIDKMYNAHETLCEFDFEIAKIDKGYASRFLRIDLSKNEVKILPVSDQMKELWTGGKGFDLWLMLQEINKNTKWNSAENPICFASGPLGGTTSFPGSGKTLVTSISPLTHNVIDSNVGGYFGPYFKFAGFDAMVVVGKAKEDVIVMIDAVNKKVTIEKAPLESIDSHVVCEELTEMYAEDEIDKRNIAVVAAGKAAEHTRMGILNFSFWDWRRQVTRLKQAGRGGIGTVFRDKNIKAIVAKNKGISPAWRIEESKASKMVTPKKISKCDCKAEIHNIINKWNSDPDFAIEMMQDIQDRYRHIPKTAIDEICLKTGTPKSELYHIATFYSTFSLEEKGETIIQVCLGTACHVKGAAKIVDALETELDIKCGTTTADKKFTLEAVACVGACSIAPVVKFGEDVVGNLKAKDVKKLVEKYSNKAGEAAHV